MRASDWKITWDPAGASPLVLLDYDDLMDSEIRLPREQLSAVGKSDFALRAVSLARQNVKARLEFSRRVEHSTAAASWEASLTALAAVPWGQKAPLRVQPRGGAARDYTAAVLSSHHLPSYQDGIIESVHRYALRVVILPFPEVVRVGYMVVSEGLTFLGEWVIWPYLARLHFLNFGRPCYGEADLSTAVFWDDGVWLLIISLPGGYQALWRSYDDVPTPDLCTTWEATGDAAGTPTVTATIL